MRRFLARRWLLSSLIGAVALLAVIASTVSGDGAKTAALPTPIADTGDFSFEELLTVKPSASASPSPSPSLVPVGIDDDARASSGSSSRRPAAASSSSGGSSDTGGPVGCPSGTVTGALTDFSASEGPENRHGVPEWTVTAKGSVTNRTSRPVRNIRVSVTLNVDNGESDTTGVTISKWVGTGSSANWTVRFDDYATDSDPDEDDVSWAVTGWSWGDGYAKCPTRGTSS